MLLVLKLSATVGTVEEEGLTVSTPMLSYFSFRTVFNFSLSSTFQLLSTWLPLAFFLSMLDTTRMNAGYICSWFTLFSVESGTASMLYFALFVLAFGAWLTVFSFSHRRLFPTTFSFLH